MSLPLPVAANSVFGIYSDLAHLESALTALAHSGFPPADISVLYPERRQAVAERSESVNSPQQNSNLVQDKATVGGGTGALIGGALGSLAGLVALAIPGLGPFLVVGPILGGLVGAGVGGVLGEIVGALVGMGLTKEEAELYQGRLERGEILLAAQVHNSEQALRVKEILERTGAHDTFSTADIVGRRAA